MRLVPTRCSFSLLASKDYAYLAMLLGLVVGEAFYASVVFAHPDNTLLVSFTTTPAHIVPEWYFISVYGVLKYYPDISVGGLSLLYLCVLPVCLTWSHSTISVVIAHTHSIPTFVTILVMMVAGYCGSAEAPFEDITLTLPWGI